MQPAREQPCPHCGVNLALPSGFTEQIGVTVQGVYGGVLYWMCPHCKGTWHAWEPGTRQYAQAQARGVTMRIPESETRDDDGKHYRRAQQHPGTGPG